MRLPDPSAGGCRRPVTRSTLLTVLLLTGGLACDRHLDVFELDAGSSGGSGSDAGGSAPDAGNNGVAVVPTDILFIVDDSCSMQNKQENLAFNFGSFVSQVLGAGEYRMGIVSTALDDQSMERAGNQHFTYSPNYPYQLIDFDFAECRETNVAHGCFRGDVIDSTVMDRQTQIETFAESVRVGTCGSGEERGLDAMLNALDQMLPGGCNAGFLRQEANLLIVIVSDEDDDSEMPVEHYADALAAYKPYGQIRVATIAGMDGGQPSSCGIGIGGACGSVCDNMPPPGSEQPCTGNAGCPDGEYCDHEQSVCRNEALAYWTAQTCASCAFYAAPDCCSALPGNRYVAFARAVEQRVHAARPEFPISDCIGLGSRVACLADTICQASFGDTLARIARELVVVP